MPVTPRPGVPDFSGICYLCGAKCDPNRFREHIPPRGCFPQGTPELITVCSCQGCNNGNSRSDELFRMLTALAPVQSESGLQVWERAIQNTVYGGRLRREVGALRQGISTITHEGKRYSTMRMPGRPMRLQLIRITKGFLRHFYPEVDYRSFEWDILMLNQFKLNPMIQRLAAEGVFYYHERGKGSHRMLFGICEDAWDVGLWIHFFHDGQGWGVRHRKRDSNAYRAHSGVHF